MVGSSLTIAHNNSLTHFNGMNTLQSIGNDLFVERNPFLNSITGLRSGTLGTGDVHNTLAIRANPALTRCEVDALRSALAVPMANDECGGNSGCTTCNVLTCSSGGGTLANQQTVYDGDVALASAEDLASFAFITTITGDVTITSPVPLLTGLENLSSVGGKLDISSCPNLQLLTELGNLVTVGGSFNIGSNPVLNGLGGLSKLMTVGGFFHIQSNAGLQNVNMPALTSVGDFFQIYSNAILDNLTGLSHVVSVGKQLSIQSNGNLTNINALIPPTGMLQTVGVPGNNSPIQILSNGKLSICATTALAAAVPGWTGTLTNSGSKACTGTCTGATCGP
jgi:hypothetical protein